MAIAPRQTVTVTRAIYRNDLVIHQGAKGTVSTEGQEDPDHFFVDFGRNFTVRFRTIGDERSRCLKFGHTPR
jgi:hypothetical protein